MPLADCSNSLKSDDSSSSSSVSLLKKPQLLSHSSIPLAGVGVGAGAAGGSQKSAAHHSGRHAVKWRGNITEVKDCEVSRSIILPDKRNYNRKCSLPHNSLQHGYPQIGAPLPIALLFS